MPSKLTLIANSIAQHIQNVTFDKLVPTRMVLNLKIDSNEKAWFLWCSALRTEESTHESLVVSVPTLSQTNETKDYVIHQQPLRIELKPSVSIRDIISLVAKQHSRDS